MKKFSKSFARIIGILLCLAMCFETNGFTALAAGLNTQDNEEIYETYDETAVDEAEETADETVIDEEETVVDDEETVVDEEETAVNEEETEVDEEEPVVEEEETVVDEEEPVVEEEETAVDDEETVVEEEETAVDEEEPVVEEKEIAVDDEDIIEEDVELNAEAHKVSVAFNEQTGELTVEGFYDWDRTDDFKAPWYSYSEKIKTAKVKVKNLTDFSYMFAECTNLTSVDFSESDTSKVTNFSHMFFNCISLETVNLKGITTNAGTDFTSMFENCVSLKELDLSKFVIGENAKTDDFFDCTYEDAEVAPGKIITPAKCNSDILLPRKYADSKSKKYEKFPKTKKTLSAVYVITYKGGEYKNPNKTEILYGQTMTLKKPTRTGYIFKEWWNEWWSSIIQIEGDSDITVKAIWEAIEYKVVLNGNGGETPLGATGPKSTTKTKTIEEVLYDRTYPEIFGEENIFVRTGYTLSGWNTKANGKGKAYTLEEFKDVKNLTTKNGATVNIYAQWKANDYTVVFNSNTDNLYISDQYYGDFGSMAEKTVKYDKKVTLPANKYTVPGYGFKGWSTEPNGEVVYKNKASVKNLAEEGTVTLYAVWKPYTYTVKFNLNGSKGKAPNTAKNLVYGKDFAFAENLTGRDDISYANEMITDRNGYEVNRYSLSQWNTKADGSGQMALAGSDATIYPTKDKQTITLYAIWNCKYYLDDNFEGGTYSTKYTSSEKTITLPGETNLSKAGYYLAGWNTDKKKADKGTVQYKIGAKLKRVSNKTFYAVWKPASYTVKFDKNAPEGVTVTGSMKSLSCKGDKTYTLPENKFKAEGYNFKGWELKISDVTSKPFKDGDEFSALASKNKEVITLKAVWEKEETYFAGSIDETAEDEVTGEEELDGEEAAPIYTLEDGVLTVNVSSDWEKANEIYAPWHSDADKITTAKVKVKNVTDLSYMFADCENLTEVNFEEIDTSATKDFSSMFANCISLKELDLSKFKIAADAKTDDFFACTLDDRTMNLEKITTPAKCGAEVLLPRKYADSKSNKYEKFPKEKKALSIVFNVSYINLGEGCKNENKSELVLGKTMTLKKPTRKGYIFDKWTDTLSNDTVTEIKGDSDHTLVANWTPIHYDLVLNGNGGTLNVDGTPDGKTKTFPCGTFAYYALLSGLGDTSSKFLKKGYTFAGWNTKANGKGTSYTAEELKNVSGLTAKNGGKVTLYAIWNANIYNIEYYINAGTNLLNAKYGRGEMGIQQVVYGKSNKLLKLGYYNRGYYFKGWSRTSNGKVEFKDRAKIKNLTDEADGTVGLYAVWAPVTYTVKFDLNGSTGKKPATIKDRQVGVESVTLPDLTGDTSYSFNTKKDSEGKNLYTFAGWSTNKKKPYSKEDPSVDFRFLVNDLTNIDIPVTKKNQVVTLYAKWRYEFNFEFYDIDDNEFVKGTEEAYYNEEMLMGTKESFQQFEDEFLLNPGYYGIGFNTNKAQAQKGKVSIKFNSKYKNIAGKTLYAVWKPINYKVKFDKNAPSGVKVTGSMSTMSCKGNKTYNLPKNKFKAEGYELKGWYVMNSRTGMAGYLTPEGKFSIAKGGEGVYVFENTKHNNDVYTLRADWTKIQ